MVIAGEGPDRKKLESLVKERGLKNVKFTGFIDEPAKLKLFSTADLFCSPALYGESFGIVLLEAMASGVVIVAGNNDGYVSVMQDRGTMSIVNPKDTEEFSRRLNLLIYDEDLRQLWKKWAAKYIRQYDYKKVVDAYEKLYHKTVPGA